MRVHVECSENSCTGEAPPDTPILAGDGRRGASVGRGRDGGRGDICAGATELPPELAKAVTDGVDLAYPDSGWPTAAVGLTADMLALHLNDASDGKELARRAARDFLALVRADYFLERMLGLRKSIPKDEMHRHVEHSIERIGKLYRFDHRLS